jgi:hypothetical protein
MIFPFANVSTTQPVPPANRKKTVSGVRQHFQASIAFTLSALNPQSCSITDACRPPLHADGWRLTPTEDSRFPSSKVFDGGHPAAPEPIGRSFQRFAGGHPGRPRTEHRTELRRAARRPRLILDCDEYPEAFPWLSSLSGRPGI